MFLDRIKTYAKTVSAGKMDHTIQLLNSLRINQEHIASELNLRLPCTLTNHGDALNAHAATIEHPSKG